MVAKIPFARSLFPQVSETGLNILYQMLQNVSKIETDKEQAFYRSFYMEILQHMFAVVTDSSQIGSKLGWIVLAVAPISNSTPLPPHPHSSPPAPPRFISVWLSPYIAD